MRLKRFHGRRMACKKDLDYMQRPEAIVRKILETTGTAMMIYDGNRLIFLVNNEFERLIGYAREEIENQLTWDVFIHPEDLQRMVHWHYLRSINPMAAPRSYEIRTKDRSGNVIQNFLTVDRIPGTSFYIASLLDLTMRKEIEQDLLRSSKLDALAILAGGIAHDFNNFLTVILGNIALAKMNWGKCEGLAELLTEMENASQQARGLTQQLLAFSREGSPVKETASISELLTESAKFMLRGSKSRCDFYIADDLWSAEVDKGQISQVIQNLLINADESMPAGGTILLRAENISIGEDLHGINSGNYLHISIEDNGHGIPEDHVQKIFDPYFTTKPKGHGLGLASCYTIIKKHGGFIRAESQAGKGSVFHVFLPASEKEIKVENCSQDEPFFCQGRILVMDDEPQILNTIGHLLRQMGYEVDYTEDGSQSIQQYIQAKNENKPYDLMILDLTVPGGMGGKETMREILQVDPTAKAIVSSGYTNDPVVTNYSAYGFRGVIPKPYTVSQLSSVLREILSRETP